MKIYRPFSPFFIIVMAGFVVVDVDVDVVVDVDGAVCRDGVGGGGCVTCARCAVWWGCGVEGLSDGEFVSFLTASSAWASFFVAFFLFLDLPLLLLLLLLLLRRLLLLPEEAPFFLEDLFFLPMMVCSYQEGRY
jgi:hypothetical protein